MPYLHQLYDHGLQFALTTRIRSPHEVEDHTTEMIARVSRGSHCSPTALLWHLLYRQHALWTLVCGFAIVMSSVQLLGTPPGDLQAESTFAASSRFTEGYAEPWVFLSF
eukprot:TRINITY_DN120694_c0_g1_i1.p3 TRINITY_DN120694_c0_g1~~TRINITY_DN120694_c0_g1_i1.p3  ORF type:complete len:109 (+),score=2.98 TRINITY_DN120694_c0_g1_i1:169-495(+)